MHQSRTVSSPPGSILLPMSFGLKISSPHLIGIAVTVLGVLLCGPSADAQSLRPSRASLNRQQAQARSHDFTFLRNPSDVRRFLSKGWLLPVRSSRDIELKGVSFPYSRPEVKLFVERLGRQYRAACGERLVVTSLTRPHSHQPRNASARSVHPTGMALDLRRPRSRTCRKWLEKTLLSLERSRVIEASYERSPPHYHLAVFPRPYARYVSNKKTSSAAGRTHVVARGENLWSIARRYRTGVRSLREANRLRSDIIRPGQVLRIPSGS